MDQLELFDLPELRIEFETRPGSRRGRVVAIATVYNDNGEPIIFLEGEHPSRRGLFSDYLRTAREALILNRERPFGDEYDTDVCRVSYLHER